MTRSPGLWRPIWSAVRVYRFVRNPMQLAVLTIIVAQALLFGSWWLVLYAVSWCLFSGHQTRRPAPDCLSLRDMSKAIMWN